MKTTKHTEFLKKKSYEKEIMKNKLQEQKKKLNLVIVVILNW
jgi:hypothetical protein